SSVVGPPGTASLGSTSLCCGRSYAPETTPGRSRCSSPRFQPTSDGLLAATAADRNRATVDVRGQLPPAGQRFPHGRSKVPPDCCSPLETRDSCHDDWTSPPCLDCLDASLLADGDRGRGPGHHRRAGRPGDL